MTIDSITLLKRLISYPSVSNQPIVGLATDIATLCDDLDFTVHTFQTSDIKQNIVAHIGPTHEDGLALSGHMDVVPVAGIYWLFGASKWPPSRVQVGPVQAPRKPELGGD